MAKLDINVLVDQTDFTSEWLLNILEETNPRFKEARGESDVISIRTEDISEGRGFCSKILKTWIQFDAPEKAPYTFVMKIPNEEFELKLMGSVADKSKKLTTNIPALHNVECDFYSLISGIKDFPLAEIYYLQKVDENTNGVIMMEDLTRCIPMGTFRTITPEHCLNAAKHFADLQAYVETLDKSRWRDKFQKCIYTGRELNDIERSALYIAQEYNNGELRDHIQFFLDIDWPKFSSYVARDKANQYNAISFCHGDAWTNNMLIRLNEDGSVSNTFQAFIDWQMAFEGNPLYDISRLIITCADAEIRRFIDKQAVDFYYDRLTEKLKANNLNVRFTREQAHELYEISCLHQTQILIKVFSHFIMPMEKSGNPCDKANTAKKWLRLRMALEDAETIIEKYNLREMFKRVDT